MVDPPPAPACTETDLTGPTPRHTFSGVGQHFVGLTVTDDEGATATFNRIIQLGSCDAPGGGAAPRALLASVACPLVVNMTGDEPDWNTGDGHCDVDDFTDGDQCTLRAAIEEANSPDRPGLDPITFDIPGTPEIVLTAPLPGLVGPVELDGRTQPGVLIDAGGGPGLVLEGLGAHVWNVAVVDAAPAALRLAGDGGHALNNVVAGLTPAGTAQANGAGIWVQSDGNTLAGVVASGNSGAGVLVESSGNRLEQVVAGLTPDATMLAPNGLAGIMLRGDRNTVVGGVFTGNVGAQVTVEGNGNRLESVIAGLSGDGSTVVPGQTRTPYGIGIFGGSSNVITGATIHGQVFGVLIAGGRGHRVEDSTITGASSAGIAIIRSAVSTVVRNRIVDADGGLAGVLVTVAPEGVDAASIPDPQPTEDNLIDGNVIGAPVPGGGNPAGVMVNGAARTVITGNLIGGNDGPGVAIIDRDGSPLGTVFTLNTIGLTAAGDPAPNAGPGVFVGGGTNAIIGGTGLLDGNTIAFNEQQGVLVASEATRTRVLGNRIGQNGLLGIETTGSDAGVTPELSLVTAGRVDVSVQGAPGSTQRVEVFSSQACDPSGAGEGEVYAGASAVTAGPDGRGLVSIQVSSPIATGDLVTATSTPEGGSTSPFSTCRSVSRSAALTGDLAAGSTSLPVSSAADFVAGYRIVVDPGGPNEEQNVVHEVTQVVQQPRRGAGTRLALGAASVSTIALAAPLQHDHQAGELLVVVGNTAPSCPGSSGTTSEDTPLPGSVACSDGYGETLTYEIESSTAHGQVDLAPDGSYTYTPNAQYSGPDSFRFTASDGLLTSEPATVAIEVTPVNDAPVCAGVSLSVPAAGTAEVAPSCTDVDSPALTYEIAAQGAMGQASVAAGMLRYSAGPAAGSDSFTYTASDGELLAEPAQVSVEIVPGGLSVTVTEAVVVWSSRRGRDKAGFEGAFTPTGFECGDDVRVTLGQGRVEQTIPGSAFRLKTDRETGEHECSYRRPRDGAGAVHKLEIGPHSGSFELKLSGIDLDGLTNPVLLGLRLGDFEGSASVTMRERRSVWVYP